jgi:hypothetical protein
MKIILEGPEGSGKSTLGKHLETLLYLPLFHAGSAPKDKAELFNRVDKIELAERGIFDRHPFISENVYGPVLRGDSLLPLIRPRNAFIIYCRPKVEVLLKNPVLEKKWKKSTTVKDIVDHRIHLIERYDRVMARILPDVTYDFIKNGVGICVG